MSCSGLHSQEEVVDEDCRIKPRSLSARPPDPPELEPTRSGFDVPGLSASHPGCWQVLVLEITAGRLALDLVLRGWEGWSVLSTPSSFHCFSRLSQGLTFLPYRRDCLLGSWAGHLLLRAFLPGIISQAGPWPFPIQLTRHVCQPKGVRFKRWRSQRRLACGNWSQGPPTCPLSPPPKARLGEFHFQDHPSAAPCLPQTFWALWVFYPGQSKEDCGSPNPECPGHRPDMQSLWQAASGRPGQGTERRRRAAADQTRDKSQLRSTPSDSGMGAPAAGAGPGWPALEESGGACSLGLRPAGSWPAAGAVCGARNTGAGSLEGSE